MARGTTGPSGHRYHRPDVSGLNHAQPYRSGHGWSMIRSNESEGKVRNAPCSGRRGVFRAKGTGDYDRHQIVGALGASACHIDDRDGPAGSDRHGARSDAGAGIARSMDRHRNQPGPIPATGRANRLSGAGRSLGGIRIGRIHLSRRSQFGPRTPVRRSRRARHRFDR